VTGVQNIVRLKKPYDLTMSYEYDEFIYVWAGIELTIGSCMTDAYL